MKYLISMVYKTGGVLFYIYFGNISIKYISSIFFEKVIKNGF